MEILGKGVGGGDSIGGFTGISTPVLSITFTLTLDTGLIESEECSTYTRIGSNPFVISGLETFFWSWKFLLNNSMMGSGICGLVSASLSSCSRITLSISLAFMRSFRGKLSSITINLWIFA